MPEKAPYTLRSAHIFVRDIEAARAFYVDILGMPLQFEA
jgi:catechol 2,3-dioxygenase-like lactoylglutathione lyase family enzyme